MLPVSDRDRSTSTRDDVFRQPCSRCRNIFLLPGKLAASIRAQAARLFVRYLSGDEALYDEVANLKHVQDYLREADPTNWRTIFAEGTGKLEPSATDDEV